MTRRTRRRLITLVITLVISAIGVYAHTKPEQVGKVQSAVSVGSYRVVEFVDGDTIKVDMNGKVETIRMIGMDTPETHDPRKPVQCFGQAAADHTKQLIGDKPVRLEADPLSTNRDRYDRLLRYVYTGDGKLIETEDIRDGYAFAYLGFPFTKSDEFHNLETEARNNHRGLWSSCQPTANDYGGYTSNSL